MGPTPSDHAAIEDWLTRHFGPGLLCRDEHRDDYYMYQAQRVVGKTTASYTIEITQEAFDYDGTATIIENLNRVSVVDRKGVADRLRENPRIHLRYYRGGRIEPSPNQPR